MKNIKLGLCAFATTNGLGYQTQAYYEHLKPEKTLVSDISAFNHLPIHKEWFTDPDCFTEFDFGFPTNETIDRFLQGLDVVICAENPLNYWMFARAKELGVKTILVPNPEFLEYFRVPALPRPDLFLLPSTWYQKEIEQFGPTKYLHLPIDRTKMPYRKPYEPRVFMHTMGNKTYMDRNGSQTVVNSMKLNKNQSVLIQVLGPSELELKSLELENFGDIRISYGLTDTVTDYAELYKGMSVLVFPRRYGGNCLPMNEALSCGMPVIMTDLEPQSSFLPKEWLVPATKKTSFKARMEIDVYEADQQALSDKMEWFANMTTQEFLVESKKADALAETISWAKLLPEYEKTIEELCR